MTEAPIQESTVALLQSGLADLRQLPDRGLVPVREIGIAVAELLRQVEFELRGQLGGLLDGFRLISKAVFYLRRGQQDGLVVAAPLLLAALERGAAADGDEDVLERDTAAVVRVDVARRDRPDAEHLRELAQMRVPARVTALVRTLQLDVETVAAERLREPGRRVRVADGEPVASAAREASEPHVQLLEECLFEARWLRLAVRAVARVRVRGGQ